MPHEYAVGYKKPPRHTRFEKGRSGNPKGRPKGTKNLATDLMEELAERILIRENGRQIRTTKQRAVVKSLFAKAMNGDARVGVALVNLIAKVLGVEDAAGEATAPLRAQEQEQLAVLEARLLREHAAAPSAATPGEEGGE